MVVYLVSFLEGVGKKFGMQTILFVDPSPKLLTNGDDVFIVLLSDKQNDGMIFALGRLPCRIRVMIYLFVSSKTR
jgi:hypothetical protein